MRRYACWEPREARRTLIDDANRDAPAVFSAVHRPTHVMRKDIRRAAADRGTAVTEHEVLEALLGGDPEEDRIVPIVGRSGAGKSHLIRWLDANVERRDDHHIVYIEKRGTSLRQVIHKILEGLDRPGIRHRERFTQLREEVDKARDLTPESARLRLLSELALTVREHGTESGTTEEDRIEREDLADRLPDLLMDPEYRVPLLADGGVIARTVDKAFGKGPDDGEAPAFEDLVLEVRDGRRAGVAAREVYDDLRGEPTTRALALNMLNEQLNFAVGSLIGVDRKQIYDVMLEVREALADEGKTLVLLVEDFALLRGLETQLLDAMIADAESRGERVLCPMRSAIAVTSGYFEGKDTALTRIHSRGGYLYSLDTDVGGDGGVSRDDVEAFVATYLNAARVGRDRLEADFSGRNRTDHGRDWVANACVMCDYKEKCHAGFGHAEGYGLYPFSSTALQRIVDAALEHFDPRHLLQIVERALRQQHEKLVDGLFPDPTWASQFPDLRASDGHILPMLRAADETTYEVRDPATAERRKVLMTFWGGAPQRAVNLDETIHEAFDLPSLAELPRHGTEPVSDSGITEVVDDGGPVVERGPDPTPKPEPRPQQDPLALALDRWGKGLTLEQRDALAVRTALTDAVLGARDWAALGISQKRLNDVVRNQAFSLGVNAKGGASAASTVIGTLEPSARHAFMLQGVMTAVNGGGWDAERGLEQQLTDFAEYVDEWADAALNRLRDSDPEVMIAQVLLLGGAALGIAGPGDGREPLLEAMFATPATRGPGDWGAFQRRLVAGPSGGAPRQSLVEMLRTACGLHRSSDEGLLIGIDTAPLLAAIDQLEASGWALQTEPASDALPRDVRLYAQALRNDLSKEVGERLRDLAARRKEALRLLGNVRDARAVVDAVGNAYALASERGIGVGAHAAERAERQARFLGADLTLLDRLSDLDRLSELSWPERLSVLVVAEREDLAPIDQYATWANLALTESLNRAAAHLAGEESDDHPVAKTTAQLVAMLRNLADDLEELPR